MTETADTLLYPRSGPWQQPRFWWQHAAELAPALPFVLAADVGMLLTGHVPLPLTLALPADTANAHPYAAFLHAAAATPAVQAAHTTRLTDSAIAAVLAHLARNAPPHHPPHQPQINTDDHRDVPQPLLDHVLARLQSLTAADIRFVHAIGSSAPTAPSLADMRALTDILTLPPLQHIVIDEVLAFLPALAEAPHSPTSQTYATNGINGLTRRGNLDAALMTEWALPDTLLYYRFLNNDLLYYGYEAPRKQLDTLLLLLVQGGDAMSGDPDMLARACTLALAQAATARGMAVRCCWFDSVLHPPAPMERPRDIAAYMQHQPEGRVDLARVLLSLQGYIQAHAHAYARIEVQWLVHLHTGSDERDTLHALAYTIRQTAGTSAIFLCAGQPPAEPPVLAEVLAQRYAVLGSAALHDAAERARAAQALRGLAHPTERSAPPPPPDPPRPPRQSAKRDVTTAYHIRTLSGHTDRVWRVAWSPNGTLLASVSSDETVRIWQAHTGACVHVCEGHTAWVLGVAWSPDGQAIASVSGDGTVRIWNAATGEHEHVLDGHTDGVYGIAWSPDSRQLASTSRDGTLRVWHRIGGRQRAEILVHKRGVWSAAWSPDGKMIATGDYSGAVQMWHADRLHMLASLAGNTNHATSVAWSPDGRMLASASRDRTARIWRVHTGTLLHTLEHPHRVRDVAWSPHGTELVTALDDTTVRIWRVRDGSQIRILNSHTNCVQGVAWASHGGMLASGSDDATVQLWGVV